MKCEITHLNKVLIMSFGITVMSIDICEKLEVKKKTFQRNAEFTERQSESEVVHLAFIFILMPNLTIHYAARVHFKGTIASNDGQLEMTFRRRQGTLC